MTLPALSPNVLRNIKAPPEGQRDEYPDNDGKGCVPGLWLRVTPNDVRTWVIRTRDANGATRRFVLGRSPDVSLAQARDLARAMRQDVRQEGRDPTRERRQARARAKVQGDGTLSGFVARYFAHGEGAKKRTAKEQERCIRSVFAKLLDRALPTITPEELQNAVRAYPSASAAGAAAMYLKAALRRVGDDDPHALALAGKLKRPSAVKERERFLREDEVAKLLRSLPAVGEDSYADAVRMLLWTGARRDEVAGMRWREVDTDSRRWTVPGERMKATRESARRPHARILPTQAMALLAIRKGEGDPRPDALVFTTGDGNKVHAWDRKVIQFQKKAGIDHFSPHDLRRTAGTIARDLKTPLDVIHNGMLAHTPDKLTRIYIRATLEKEAGEAMQRLADRFDALLADNVVTLQRA